MRTITDNKDLLHIVILASGKSSRFMNSIPENTFMTTKPTSKLDLPLQNNSTMLGRLCEQMTSINSSKVFLVCDPSISTFSHIKYDNLYRVYTHPDTHNNCYSLASYFKTITRLPKNLIIIDADTCIPDKSFNKLSREITNIVDTDISLQLNYIVVVDKNKCFKSNNEWSIETQDPVSVSKVLYDSTDKDKPVTAGITIFRNPDSIHGLSDFVLNDNNYDTYWDVFYSNDINDNHSDLYRLLIIGNVYEVDNYNDYLIIKSKLELGDEL